ncbi:neuronal acetylcholine receptor subunit alpha-10-like [Saccoglossus kowalevskii]|uniref:Neuronal acetylcholine receptor subunit alpha-9-like n=1 Tax=Saccoglossus kowalevskii TaxID=10224 RepID=A0ABM0GPW2_SACKO|nr:PREDICTED: neuronal acetylcholine receptor subunit alpha-9-like [Saccoglossus kowalevskii]
MVSRKTNTDFLSCLVKIEVRFFRFFIIAYCALKVVIPITVTANPLVNTDVNNSTGNCLSNYHALFNDLFDDYNKLLRPVRDASVATNVTFGISVIQIIDVDERNQIITMSSWMRQKWVDEYLRWNPDDYGGIDVIRLPATLLWRPDITLYDNVDEKFERIKDANAIINSDGSLTWLAPAIYKSACKIDVRYFPFDIEKCSMKFGSWTFDGAEINLTAEMPSADIANFKPNGEWELVDAPVIRNVLVYPCCEEIFPDLTYTIIIRRKPTFYVLNLLLPNVLISVLATMSFYLPPDSGEKIALSMTSLLTLFVFNQVVGETMPPTSDDVPIIAQYFSSMIVIVSISCVTTVWVLNLYYVPSGYTTVPRWFRKFVFDFLAPVVYFQRHYSPKSTASKTHIAADEHAGAVRTRHDFDGFLIYNGNSIQENSTKSEEMRELESEIRSDVTCARCDKKLDNINSHVTQFSRRYQEKDSREKDVHEWREIAEVIDRFMLHLFLISIAITTTVLMVRVVFGSADR